MRQNLNNNFLIFFLIFSFGFANLYAGTKLTDSNHPFWEDNKNSNLSTFQRDSLPSLEKVIRKNGLNRKMCSKNQKTIFEDSVIVALLADSQNLFQYNQEVKNHRRAHKTKNVLATVGLGTVLFTIPAMNYLDSTESELHFYGETRLLLSAFRAKNQNFKSQKDWKKFFSGESSLNQKLLVEIGKFSEKVSPHFKRNYINLAAYLNTEDHKVSPITRALFALQPNRALKNLIESGTMQSTVEKNYFGLKHILFGGNHDASQVPIDIFHLQYHELDAAEENVYWSF